ncbi:MAG: hypothetical protein A3F13_02585 [Gammaproteobacteria bacterium RIFCSPHIGHO2_12_FULL_40_19]|nr:MAG: hypothetical protein A3F13_02585 [Gammaproteobacteria bacterium RIFCSPHIGHO2_12_FULL_40_19]
MAVVNNSINDKIGGANSGATNTLTVDNASNTASSAALVNLTVGGTSAGDAFETFTVAGTTNWSLGVDNSDSDAFVIAASTALGTTNVMRASTAGEINYPLQPAFLAQLSTTELDVAGNTNGTFDISFDTEVFDQGGNFSTSTFRITAPVTGRYYLSTYITILQLTAAMVAGYIRFATSNRNIILCQYNAGLIRTVAGTADTATQGGSCLCDMDAGDTSTTQIYLNGGVGKTADANGGTAGCFYSGYLVC